MIRWFLDNTLEVATAYLRALALLLPLGAIACFVAAIWAPTGGEAWRLCATGGLFGALGVAAGMVGFYWFGNEEWRPRRGDADG